MHVRSVTKYRVVFLGHVADLYVVSRMSAKDRVPYFSDGSSILGGDNCQSSFYGNHTRQLVTGMGLKTACSVVPSHEQYIEMGLKAVARIDGFAKYFALFTVPAYRFRYAGTIVSGSRSVDICVSQVWM